MFTRMLAILAILAACIQYNESLGQYIQPLPGLIPVYIRNGDTPLEEINPDLAEAFDSYAIKHAKKVSALPDKIRVQVKELPSKVDLLALNEDLVDNVIPVPTRFFFEKPQHIQRIPRN